MPDIEELAAEMEWRDFESLVAEIFRAHDFKVRHNFRFKTKNRHEIDIIAAGREIICVDCKQWSGGRHKVAGLKNAAKAQKGRVGELKKFLAKNPIASHSFGNKQMHPLIVTLMDEEIIKYDGVWIVPLWKLNSFLSNRENYV